MVKSFGEDPKQMQPDEFFGVFDMFLNSFTDARLENDRIKRVKEEEEKRAKMEEKVRPSFFIWVKELWNKLTGKVHW